MNEDKNMLENWTGEKIITSENLKIGYIKNRTFESDLES